MNRDRDFFSINRAALISTHRNPIEGRLVGKHDLVIRFLRGARRLNPPKPSSLPSWHLALMLRALQTAPFEPLQSAELKFLSFENLTPDCIGLDQEGGGSAGIFCHFSG